MYILYRESTPGGDHLVQEMLDSGYLLWQGANGLEGP